MSAEQTTEPGMFCRVCGYALVGLSENRCPECGRAFDPADPRTFRYPRRPPAWVRWLAARRKYVPLVASGGAFFGSWASLVLMMDTRNRAQTTFG